MNRRNFVTLGGSAVAIGTSIAAFPATLPAFIPINRSTADLGTELYRDLELIAKFNDPITGLCSFEGSVFVATGQKVYRLNKEIRRF